MRIRVATKEAQKLPKGWEVMVRLWLLQLAHTIYTNNIPPELVVNADQIGFMLVPVGGRINMHAWEQRLFDCWASMTSAR